MLWIKTQQVCATCALWDGKRKTTYSFAEALCDTAQCIMEDDKETSEEGYCRCWTPMTLEP